MKAAKPRPTNHMPSVTIKDGIRNATCSVPEIAPASAPTKTAAIEPAIVICHEGSVEMMSAITQDERAITPSIERSVPPTRITKVAPSESTMRIADEVAIREALEKVRKLSVPNPRAKHSMSSTRRGAALRNLALNRSPAPVLTEVV
jgi:hypothetical protein